MRERLGAFGILALSTVLSACSSDVYEPTPKFFALKPDHAMSFPASISHTMIHSRKNDWITCTTPAPDANFDQSQEGDFNFSLISVGGSGSNNKGGDEAESSGESEMAGRTPAVLISRELFFRTCEFSRNYQLEKNEAIDLYKATMQAVMDGWKIEAGNTKVSVGDALTSNQGINPGANLPNLPSRGTTSSTGGAPTTGVTSGTLSSPTSTTSGEQ
jgi:hypothetical protein